jgi:hypothetical protein
MELPQEQPTPEEQTAYEKTVLAAMDLVHNEKTRDTYLQLLQRGAKDPARTLGVNAANIVAQLDEQSGNSLPEDIIPHVAGDVVSMLGELADASGAFPVDENVIGKAGQFMIQRIAELYGATLEDAKQAVGSVSSDQLSGIADQQSSFAGGTPNG